MTRPRCVAFVAANDEGARTGNERTTTRLARAMRETGIHVELFRPGDDDARVTTRLAALDPRPDLVHAFHARRAGPRAARIARELEVPLVVGVTGTDLAVDIHRADRAPIVLESLRQADAVTCGNADEVAVVKSLLLSAAPPCVVLPKGVAIPDELPTPALHRVPGQTLVLQVANVRPVKNVALAVRAVGHLREAGASMRLVVLGDVLDTEYERDVEDAAGGLEAWSAILHPSVPSEEMGRYYAAADIVLNTSHGEGGSNALLEAMAHERAVVASAVAGNIAYVGADEWRGLLYDVDVHDDGIVAHDDASLIAALRRLHESPGLRSRLGDSARQWIAAQHGATAELDALLSVYAHALATS